MRQILYLIACVLIPVYCLLVVADFSKFTLGEFDGKLYLNLITPTLGIIYFFVFFVLVKPKSGVAVAVILTTELVTFSMLHYYTINVSGISGDFHEENIKDYLSKPTPELFQLLSSRNRSVSWTAWQSLETRESTHKGILLKYIYYREKLYPTTYMNEMYVQQSIEKYAKDKDVRVIPHLKRMLESKEYAVTESKKLNYRFYSTRYLAKELLKKYYDIDVKVETKVEIIGKN